MGEGPLRGRADVVTLRSRLKDRTMYDDVRIALKPLVERIDALRVHL
jgi:hypothetical protein